KYGAPRSGRTGAHARPYARPFCVPREGRATPVAAAPAAIRPSRGTGTMTSDATAASRTSAPAVVRRASAGWTTPVRTARLVLADGRVIEGYGLGAEGTACGEVCFNTAMTGYQEILTDPSYAGQIVTFTFPHVGNVGVNEEDGEAASPAAASAVRGVVLRAPVTASSSHRAMRRLDDWLAMRGIIGICGVDTRTLTRLIRDTGMPNAVIAHAR